MALDPRTPVLAGAGQVVVRPDPAVALEERPEPVELMARSLEAAARDCGGSAGGSAGGSGGGGGAGTGAGARLLDRAQSLRVMVPLCWSYVNPALLVAERLGIDPAEHALSVIGGNGPQTVAAASAAAIAEGRLDVALVVGAECLYTRVAARRRGEGPALGWTTQPPDTPAPLRLGAERRPVTDTELARGLDRPRNVFPLFENALRAAAGDSVAEHQVRVSELWSGFSGVAATNPYAWSQTAYPPEALRTVDGDNRMIAFPYLKRMNANDRVDMGAALILCSLEAARAAGVPDDNLVFPLAAADAHDHWFLSERADLHSSPAIGLAAAAAFDATGLGLDDVSLLDLYSCFPCAVEMAAAAIGVDLDDPRGLTVTGGLGFAGGPGNNYVTHSLAAMAGRLRAEPGAVGLVTGLGWYATKHAVGLWSSAPGSSPFVGVDAQPAVDATERRIPAPVDLEGDVTVETYTVVHDRQGEPELGILALLDDEGRRAWGNITDGATLRELETEEGCGTPAKLHAEGRVDLL